MPGDAHTTTAPPSEDEVQRIAAIANPALRNLEITHCYSLLAGAFAARSGEGANWCTFATWASRQAGHSIRGEDLRAHFDRKLGEGRWLLHPVSTLWRRLLRRGLLDPGSRLGRLTAGLHTPFDAIERASASVSRGNLKVFAEIGLEFARYLHTPDDRFELFLDGLRPGDPPDGQRYLRQAFERYHRLAGEADGKARAQLAVLANLEIGFHEQTRLQPEIREALDATSATKEDLGGRALESLFPSAARWWSPLRRPVAGMAGMAAAGVQRASSNLAREVITESFLVLSVPGRVLALGTHLADDYPDVLLDPADADLLAFLAQHDPAGPANDDCGARDWSDLGQRMHYIVHLFSAFHLRDELGDPPFTPEQVRAIRRGVVPDGEL